MPREAVEPAEVHEHVEHSIPAANELRPGMVIGEPLGVKAKMREMGRSAGLAEAGLHRGRGEEHVSKPFTQRCPAAAERVDAFPEALRRHVLRTRLLPCARTQPRITEGSLDTRFQSRKVLVFSYRRFRRVDGNVPIEQPCIGGEHRDGPDADTGAVRRSHAIELQPLHFPQMRELVLAAAGRPRIPVRLNGEPGHEQSRHESRDRARLPPRHRAGIGEP